MNAADLMLAPGNIFKADIRERPCQRHKREYRRSTANHPGCQQWQGKANIISYMDIARAARTPRLTRPGSPPRRSGAIAGSLRTGQGCGWFTSSGTDSALITARDVGSGDVIAFRVQSVSTRRRLPDMANR